MHDRFWKIWREPSQRWKWKACPLIPGVQFRKGTILTRALGVWRVPMLCRLNPHHAGWGKNTPSRIFSIAYLTLARARGGGAALMQPP